MAINQTDRSENRHGVDYAAQKIGVSPLTLRRLAKRREIGHFRVGTGRGTYRFSDEHINQYLRGRTVEVEPQAA